MFSSDSVHLQFDVTKPSPHRGWVKYFVAALGLGMGAVQAQEQKLLDYWWVMPREEVKNAPRVIRVIGAKGEKFEEVYAEEQAAALRGSAAIMQARLERQASLRLEAQQRARELREAGKSPAVAYEEAWAEVYSRRWLNADWRVGSSKLEDMLTRVASDNEDFALTEEEQQWVLEALLEDDDRLESAEGIELLRNLARRLRSMGYGKIDVTAGVNDELMMRFADAMRHGKESMAAYRNALFTTHRDRVMHHELRGYVAPWGMGAGGTRSYRQAPVALTPSAGTGNTRPKRPAPLTITSEYMKPVLMAQQEFDIAEILPGEDEKDLGSAEPAPHLLQQQVQRVEVAFSGRDTTSAYSAEVLAGAADSGMLQVQSTPQSHVTPSLPMVATSTYSAPGLNDLPGALADFRATAPAPVPNEESVEGAEEEKEDEENERLADESEQPLPAASVPRMMMARSMSLRSTGAVTLAAGDIVVTENASYHAKASLEHGNLNDATWGSATKRTGNSWWASSVNYDAWTEGTAINGTIDQIDLDGGNLYLGNGYTGLINVISSGVLHAEATETKSSSSWLTSVSAVVPVAGKGVFNYGTLSGSGSLTLSNNAASGNALVYIFNDTSSASWFEGTVKFGASQGGIVQLDLAPHGSTTNAWDGVVFDMTPTGQKTSAYGVSSSNAPNRTILNVRGPVTIAGLIGGNSASTVTSESTDDSFVLILGENSDKIYDYGGTFKGSFYNDAGVLHTSPAGLNITKQGTNTQIFSADIEESNALHNVRVENGTLQLASAYVNKVNVVSGTLVAEDLYSLGTVHVPADANGLPTAPEEVQVSGTGELRVTGLLSLKDDLYVSGSGTVSAARLEVQSNILINSDLTDAPALSVSGSSYVAGDAYVKNGRVDSGALQVGGALIIGDDDDVGTAHVNVSTSTLTADELRLRADGELVTTGAVQVSTAQYLHGGASWTMVGASNVLQGTMNVRELTESNPVGSFSGSGNKAGDVVLTMPGVIDFENTTGSSWWSDPGSAVFHLDGVTLDFGSGGTTIFRNFGFTVSENMSEPIVLATLEDGTKGWFDSKYPSVILQGHSANYHGVLDYQDGCIVIKVEHAIATPFVVKTGGSGYENKESGASGVVYLQMPADAQTLALPLVAYDDAVYSAPDSGWVAAWNGWNDATPVPNAQLLAFSNIQLQNGARVYLGESATLDANTEIDYRLDRRFDGNIELANASAPSAAELHGQVGTWGNWTLGGHLGGSGHLKLVAHNGAANSASVFTFANAQKPNEWLRGRLSMADPGGGVVQLNVGNVNIAGMGDTRWDSVVVDMGRSEFEDSVVGQTGTAARISLALLGDTTVEGLDGGNADSQVVSNLRKTSNKAAPTLTIGGNGASYSYGGTLGEGSFYEGDAWSTVQEQGKDIETNHYSTREGSLNLVKVGANTQSFTNLVHAESVDVQGGTLSFSGDATIETLTVRAGATVETDGSRLEFGAAYLYGGSTWRLSSATDFSTEPIHLVDMQDATVNITSSSQVGWTSMKQLDLANAGSPYTSDALFTLGNKVTLTLSNTLTITNVGGVTENSSFALIDLGGNSFSLGNQSVLVMDSAGEYYNASYRVSGGHVYVDIAGKRDSFGILVVAGGGITASQVDGYYWSGVAGSGSTQDDVNHMGLSMGHVWRADGSADDSGWHEQRIGSVAPGVYQNNHKVIFSDYSVHHYTDQPDDSTTPHRIVLVQGKVAPGEMLVVAENDAAKIGGGEAEMRYGYVFQQADGSDKSRISDYTDANGNIIQRTSITKTGGNVLILHMPNDFTGGIDVQNGTLYFSRPGAGGSGPITLHNDKTWTDYWDVTGSNSTFRTQERTGVEFMVNYQHSSDVASAYRNPWVSNTLLLEGDAGKHVTISYARAAYTETTDDFSNVPRHWRNLNLTGGVFGDGDLHLRGYTSTYYAQHDQSYVASFSINKSQLNKTLLTALGKELKDFSGTVTLENTVNWSHLNTDKLSDRTAGSVQLVLQDDVFAKGHVNLTREEVDKTENMVEDNRQSFANILVVNGDVSVGALSGAFRGNGYFKDGYSDKGYDTLTQAQERWRVRTVTASETTLTLGRSFDTAGNTYVYSGTMGFAQSYTQPQQAHILSSDDGLTPYADAPSNFKNSGSYSNGVERLSLVKKGEANQYIHSAVLNDLSVYGGTLGFNYLNLKGNLNMVDGTTLHLGVTDNGTTGWKSITGTSYNTTDKVTLNSGKTLTVISAGDLQKATVDGNVTMGSGSALTFLVNASTPYSLSTHTATRGNESDIVPLLEVTGTLALQGNQPINLNFSNVEFQTGLKYYLASADAITVGGNSDETTFGSRMVPLGYGYFGTLYTVGNNGSSSPASGDIDKTDKSGTDYLVMTVSGDPRHTWHGYTDSYEWVGALYTDKDRVTTQEWDYRWKENTAFINGDVVLFGNLYTPTKWEEKNRLTSDESVKVLTRLDGNAVAPKSGTLVQETAENESYDFNIDGFSVENISGKEGFQAVKVNGRVAPFIVMINANYESQEKNGETVTTLNSQTEDGTNYYFYTTDALKGYIDNASEIELETAGFNTNWKTMLHKTGTGTTVMALDNRYTGGTILQGNGLMVMQHANALGYIYDVSEKGRAGKEENGEFIPYEATITLMDGAALQGDFDDEDFEGNYPGGSVSVGGFMHTTTINNTIVVNEYADPSDPDYVNAVDGRLINSFDKKLILRELVGESDTVLELNGVGLTAEQSREKYDGADNVFRYGVFKVLDPSRFYGTVRMNGRVWGAGPDAAGGKVQLDVMSTAKSAPGADWTNARIDLSLTGGTERTVLGLDVTSSGETCVVDSISGSLHADGSGSSSVLNISRHYAAILELMGMRNGDYDGVLGYGDFQVAVNYGGYADSDVGVTKHHYGAEGHGTLDVLKHGDATTQSARRAWLNDVTVEGGVFMVDEAMVARSITAGGTTRVRVGQADPFSLYTLAVGDGAILAMNTGMEETGAKTDALAGVSAGTDLGDVTGDSVGSGTAFVRLENGAILSGREDWFTGKQIDIYNGAAVTVNTHNFTIDPYILNGSEVEQVFVDKRDKSHIIQLLGKLTGADVTLNINNWMIDPTTNKPMDAAGQEQYMKHVGYVAINDINEFTGTSHVNVGAMAVLQLLQGNDGTKSDVRVTVEGEHATLQILDKQVKYTLDEESGKYAESSGGDMVQYIAELTLGDNKMDEKESPNTVDPLIRPNKGQLLLGGTEVRELKPANEHLTAPKLDQIQVLVSSRHHVGDTEILGRMDNLNVDMSGSAVSMGGSASATSNMQNVHMDMVVAGNAIHHARLDNSLVHLHEDCSVDISEMVLLESDSAVRGAEVRYDETTFAVIGNTIDPFITTPNAATGSNPLRETVEVGTSVNTTVQLTFANNSYTYSEDGGTKIHVLLVDQFQAVDVAGDGITLQLTESLESFLARGYNEGARFIALQIGGGSGRFEYEADDPVAFARYIDSFYVLQEEDGSQVHGHWVTADYVATQSNVGSVSPHLLYFEVPEPATTTLSLLALTALCARRRRR